MEPTEDHVFPLEQTLKSTECGNCLLGYFMSEKRVQPWKTKTARDRRTKRVRYQARGGTLS